jgi:hypothetical protein
MIGEQIETLPDNTGSTRQPVVPANVQLAVFHSTTSRILPISVGWRTIA